MRMYIYMCTVEDTCILRALCLGGSEGDADAEVEGDEEEEESALVAEVMWVWPECWGCGLIVMMYHRLVATPLPP